MIFGSAEIDLMKNTEDELKRRYGLNNFNQELTIFLNMLTTWEKHFDYGNVKFSY